MGQFQSKTKVSLSEGTLSSRIGNDRKLFTKAKVIKVYLDYEKTNDEIVPPGVIEAINIVGSKPLRAYPIDETFTSLPVVGEIVEIFRISMKPYYRRLTITGLSINTSSDVRVGQALSDNKSKSNRFTTNIGPGSRPIPEINADEYKNLSIQTNSNTLDQTILKSSFKKEKVQRLKYFEGDTILQSRFGQSIRFSGYNNSFNELNPTLTLRNANAKVIGQDVKEDETTEENINTDGGTILFSSGKYISSFLPGQINKNQKSNFELKVWENNEKYALENYPKKLDGNQIIISSDRLILSSRVNETIFFSKGPLSFVADSYFTVDSNKGMSFVSQKGDIQFQANDLETKFFVGKNGKIFLGIEKDSPSYALVNGKALIDAIGEIVNEIIAVTYGGILTPAGPTTGMTPDKQQKLKSIMSKLPSVLSKKVFIGM